MFGTLYIVATPIGNLEDLSERAKRILSEVDFILAEDTRVTQRLLSFPRKRESDSRSESGMTHIKIISFHQHSSEEKISAIIRELHNGKNYALVTDAGTPNISDPGGKLVEAAHEAGVTVVPIPGPNAAITCLSASGLPADEFTFLGFPPHKKGRETWFKNLANYKHTVVFYESPYRIQKTLDALKNLYPDATVCVCRELTKKFEEVIRSKAKDLPAIRAQGEFTVALRV